MERNYLQYSSMCGLLDVVAFLFKKSGMKYLPRYYRWMKAGRLEMGGLCHNFPHDRLMDLMKPDECANGYWAYWKEFYDEPIYSQDLNTELSYKLIYAFNPLRQNIVLFLAAMNNEL